LGLTKKILIPPYFGPISTWAEIYNCDVIWDIHKNYNKQSYRNRTFIHSANGVQKLTVPIKHSLIKFTLNDSYIDNSTNWQQIHWKSIKIAYSSSPYFEFYKDSMEVFFSEKYTKLLDLNMKTIKMVSEWLEVDLNNDFSKKYVEDYNTKFDLRNLIEHKNKRKKLIPYYTQVFSNKNGFINDLSIIDLIFNEGPNSLRFLK
jgi:hypothetical protein